MKRSLSSLLLILLLVWALTIPASADVVWEPMENEYYAQSYDTFQAQHALTWLEHFYVVPEGMTVCFYDAPDGDTPKEVLEAGTRVFVHSSAELDGTVWAIGYPAREYDNVGWFRLGQMQREYDCGDFRRDFRDQFQDYKGELDGYRVKDRLYSWTYPGSGVLECTLTEISEKRGGGEFQYTYTDPEGGLWGYVDYHMGHWHGDWIYLTDPENPDPPSFPQPVENTVTDTRPSEDRSASVADHSLMWITVLVLGVTILTAVLIRGLKHKKETPPT